jgi:hypothetical protein
LDRWSGTGRAVERCWQGAGYLCRVPSSEYFRRQAEICLQLSLISSEEAANRLILMAREYEAKADALEAQPTMAMPTIIGPSTSPDRETNET